MPKWSFLMTTLAVLSHNTRTKSLNAMMLNKKGALLAILLLMVALIPEALHAQTGILRGKITDAEMGDELIGATVMLKGTTTGAAADLDGNYSITGIPAGTYDIICQFISYEPKTITGVVIKSDEVTIINVGLSTVSMGLQEVVVSAKAVNRSEAAMLTIQKKSANVVDGLSAQQMKKAGDSDAAGALKRVTGVNVEDGKYVYVRGLSDRYSKTTLNGADIPGLDPNRNTVQMDIFPTNLIENMVVYKTFSPNLPADFTGGYVDIITLDFPEQFMLSFGIKAGYNTQASLNNNFLGYKGSSTDFLGYDNGLRNIPGAAKGTIPQYNANTRQTLTDITESFNKVMSPSKQSSTLNRSLSFTIGNQITLGKNALGYIFGLSYKYNENFYDDAVFAEYTLSGANEQTLTEQKKYHGQQSEREALWGALANVSYKLGQNHKLSANFFKNQSGNSGASYTMGPKRSDGNDLLVETRQLYWLERSLNSGQLRGEHYFPALSKLKVDWIGSFTASMQEEPDFRVFTNSYYPDNEGGYQFAVDESLYSVPARYYRKMTEQNTNIKINFELPLSSKENAPKLLFGGGYSYKTRTSDENRFDYKFQFSKYVYDGNPDNFFTNENIGLNYPGYNPSTGSNFGLYIQGNAGDDLINSYTADQTIGAGYAMIDAVIQKKLRVIAGVRLESTLVHASSNDSTKDKGYLNNTDPLPALNLTYFLNQKTNLRLNVSRTIARPTFRELAPYSSEDFKEKITYVGNPNLKRTTINNIDLRYEYFISPTEILSAGLFAKLFTDPIEVADNPRAINQELTWINVDQATVYGVEFDVRKKLDFINAIKNIKLSLNFTYVYSEVAIDSAELESIRATDPEAKDTRPMGGQSPYVLNAAIGYENPNLGLEANLVYNVTGAKLVVLTKGGTPDIYEQPFNSLNLIITKQLNDSFLLEFNAKNILNPVAKKTYSYMGQEYIYRSYTKGSVFELGIKYKIK